MTFTPTPGSALPSQVGDIYDIAIGYSQDGVSGEMVGYVTAPGSTFEQDSDIQDSDRIVQISSPNSTDRFSIYPKVSQGDWSGGERQEVYVTPNQYYQATGMDVSQPGHLRLLPKMAPLRAGVADLSNYHCYPMATDGIDLFIGFYQVGASNLLLNLGTQIITSLSAAPIDEMLASPAGIWLYQNPGLISLLISKTGTQVAYAYDYIDYDAAGGGHMYNNQNMAYFGGILYFVSNQGATTAIRGVSGPWTGAGVIQWTAPDQLEGSITCLASTANGLFFSRGAVDVSGPMRRSILHTFDGTTATRIGDVPGIVRNAVEIRGVTYILTVEYQMPNDGAGNVGWNYCLYSLSGSTLSLIDDLRIALPDFQVPAQPVSPMTKSQMFADGADLYVAWNGYSLVRYNTVTKAVSRVTAQNERGGTVSTVKYSVHRVVKTGRYGLVELRDDNFTGPEILQWSAAGGALSGTWSGQYLSSDYDFGSPATVKRLRSLTIELNRRLTGLNAINPSYNIDGNDVSQPLTPIVDDAGNLVCYFPAGTVCSRVRIYLNVVGDTAHPEGYPDIKSYSILGTLGRVWKVTLACRRNQRGRNDEPDPHKKRAMDLLANLENAYDLAAGDVMMYVPDSTAGPSLNGPINVIAAPAGVSVVQATIQSINRVNNNGSAAGLREDPASSEADMEADVTCTIVEQLPG